MRTFTAFWEANGPDGEEEMRFTALQPLPTDELLDRLRDRMNYVPAGTIIRVDMVAVGDFGAE